MIDPHDDLAVNRALWTVVNEEFTDARAHEAWAGKDFVWGLFGNPERQLRALGDVADRDVIELGCGTAYISAWLARLGARPVGVDLTRRAAGHRPPLPRALQAVLPADRGQRRRRPPP